MKKIVKKPTAQQQKEKAQIGMSEQNFKIYLRIKPTLKTWTNQNKQNQSQTHVQHVANNGSNSQHDTAYFNQTPHINHTLPPHQTSILKILTSSKVQITSPYHTVNQVEKIYSYEEVFDETVNNIKVFQQTMLNPVNNALQGYNSTVFIYGMTGSGKTYTMFGSLGSVTNKDANGNIGVGNGYKNMEEDGLVPMTIDYMFGQIEKQPHIKSLISVSFYEIYNENIRDLLTHEQNQQQSLVIMEDPIRGVFINGLTQVQAQQKNQIKDIIFAGIQKRAMNATRSNQVSSRSHAILQFSVKRYMNIVSQNANYNDAAVLQSKFFMIDLAGNQKTANNQSRRFIQGVNINKSLLTLGKCLSILAERKAAYVPFRDSKLTRILKQSLGGNSKTVMIACVSAERRFYEQTLNTLKYSNIARKIKNKGVKHNFKLITKQQMPDCKNFVNNDKNQHIQTNHYNGEVQNKIKNVLAGFLSAVQAKIKVEVLLQDLQNSRKENQDLLLSDQSEHETCKRNIRKLNDTIQLLMRPYQKHLQKVQTSYYELMDNIHTIIKDKKSPSAQNLDQIKAFNHQNQCNTSEIARLKQIIANQNKKIEEYEGKKNVNSFWMESKNQQFDSFANKSLESNKTIKINNFTPMMQKQNSLPVFAFNCNNNVQPPQRSQSKAKKLTINCGGQNEDTFRSQSSGALQLLNSSNMSGCSRGEKKSNRFQRQIVINLNAEQVQKKSHQSSRDQFVKKLKETEKKVKGAQSEQISSLLKQHEANRYELGNVEMSMIRKLKFFQREKSLQKSSSLGKILTKTHQPIRVGLGLRRY